MQSVAVGGGPTRALGYSASGNTDTDDNGLGTVRTLAWDSADRLVSVADGTGTLGECLHNAMGQRVQKTVGAATTHYLYDLSGRLIAEADGATGATVAEYIAFEGMLLAHVATGGVNWVHVDHLGTPQVLTDGTGAVVWDASYRPFGEASVTGSVAFNLRFPGQYFDAETGLHYNYFRDYDAGLGRYLESDPIGLRGGWNTYAYVGGNPVMRVDPRGLRHEGSDTAGEDVRQMYCLAAQFVRIGVDWPDWDTKVRKSHSRVDYWSYRTEGEISIAGIVWDTKGSCSRMAYGILQTILARIVHEGMHLGQPEAQARSMRFGNRKGHRALDDQAVAIAQSLEPAIMMYCSGIDFCSSCPAGVEPVTADYTSTWGDARK